jgi:hypothetical protein
MRTVLIVVGPPLFLFGLALLVMLVPLPHSLSRRRNLVAAIAFGLLGMAFLFGLANYFLWSFINKSKAIDPAFTSLGLRAESYALFGRRYRGTIDGRWVDVYYVPAHRYQPNSLDVYLDIVPQTRLTISRGWPILGCSDCQPLTSSDPDLAQLQVWALDEGWGQALLAEPAAKAALLRLTVDLDERRGRELYFNPGVLQWRITPSQVTPEGADQWLQDLAGLARAAEGLPNPTRLADPSGLEAAARDRGAWVGKLINLILLVSAVPVLVLCLGALVYALLRRGR